MPDLPRRTAALLLSIAMPTAVAQEIVGPTLLATAEVSDPINVRYAALDDLDGDGVRDFAAGGERLNPSRGEVALYSGREGTRLRDLVAAGSTTAYPSVIADAGDVDRDGVRDIAVGTVGGAFDGFRGAVRVYSGRSGSLLRTLQGEQANERYGLSIASAGDVDGDAVADLLVGAPFGASGAGRVALHSGATGTVIRAVPAPADARSFGFSVAAVRDFDGDRVADFVVGAPAFDGGTRHVYAYGSTTAAPARVWQGAADANGFGMLVGNAGDFDRDGRGDVYAGSAAPTSSVPGLYQVLSPASGATLFETRGQAFGDELGRGGGSVDFDGDGDSDVIVASARGAAANGGTITVHAAPDGAVLQRFVGTAAGANLGFRTAPLGDVDGDGALDLLATTFGGGRVHVVAGATPHGGRLLAPTAAFSGIWYDPAHAGEGFIVEMLDARSASIYYFTYTADGRQRYLFGVGTVIGTRIVVRALQHTRGGRLGGRFDPAAIDYTAASSLVLAFDHCDRGHADYTIDGVAGSQRLQRLTRPDGLRCDGTVMADAPADLSGLWYDGAHGGEGWVLQSLGDRNYALTWFTYDDAGAQQWFTATARLEAGVLAFASLQRPAGGRFGIGFDPAEVTRTPAGTVRFDAQDCDGATVQWSQAGGGASTLRRLTALRGLGCTP